MASHGVMEGKGAYNRHARLPAGGAALALPALQEAAEQVVLDAAPHPVVIADYGSSQGRNSLVPMGVAIECFRARIGRERAIFVYHVDQPSNDFNSLFAVLDADPDRYTAGDANVFPCAIGRSFYEGVLPPQSVDLAWSSYAAVWLSRLPGPIPDHFFALGSGGAVRAEFARQAARDWETFLSLRATELRPGGRLAVVLPAVNDDGLTGFEGVAEHANAVLAEMVAEGAITAEERARMVLGSYPRRRSELLAPFESDGEFRQLTVKRCDLTRLSDAVWADYQHDGDQQSLAFRHAAFFRTVFAPSLAGALARVQDPAVCSAFLNRLEEHLQRRLAAHPAPMHSWVQTIVCAKHAPA
jgi:hypothetical protein